MTKKLLIIFLAILQIGIVNAQLNVNVKLNPPFTPFIADYTNPSRLQDISVSLFNSSSSEMDLKFSFSLTNRAKGISIVLKETSSPAFALKLMPNEFRILSLDDVSKLYQGLNQGSFDIQGVNIERLLLDGTLPDGYYEFCIRAYNFNSPGFSQPISQASPIGCAGFNIIYPDPPTDIRINNSFLNYRYGNNVPVINFSENAIQAHTINFTPPAFNIEGLYEYELLIFEEMVLNPLQMPEAQMIEAVNTLQPFISKKSFSPVFFIDQSDMRLLNDVNYYLFIRVVDLNARTIFKNKGISAIQAFRFKDLTVRTIFPPNISSLVCGRDSISPDSSIEFTISFTDLINLPPTFYQNLECRFLVKRFFRGVTHPPNIFTSGDGIVIVDTIIKNKDESFSIDTFKIKNLILKGDTAHYNKLFVAGIKFSVKGEDANLFQLVNSGVSFQTCEILTGGDPRVVSSNVPPPLLTRTNFNITYPLEGDTIPFMFPPIIINYEPTDTQHVALFTKFDGDAEPTKTNRIYLLNDKSSLANDVLNLNIDTAYKQVRESLERAAIIELSGGDGSSLSSQGLQVLSSARGLANNQVFNRNPSFIILGGDAATKIAITRAMINYNSNTQLFGVEDYFNNPDFAKVPYILPYRTINWNASIGIYTNKSFDPIPFFDYFTTFNNGTLQSQYPTNRLVTNGYTNIQGRVNVGMKAPVISSFNTRSFKQGTRIPFVFVPSARPKKLFPDDLDERQWKEYGLLNIAQQFNIEISKDPSFTDLYEVYSERIIKTYEFPVDKNAIEEDLYNTITRKIKINEPGHYYWRVTWSNITADSSDESSKTHFRQLTNLIAGSQLLGQMDGISAEDLFFKRVNYSISRIDSFEVVPYLDSFDCYGECEHELTDRNIALQNQGIEVNSIVHVGKFEMKISSISFAGNKATGEGSIMLPRLSAPLFVTFKNIEINTNNRMVRGTVKGDRKQYDLIRDIIPELPNGYDENVYDFLKTHLAENPNDGRLYRKLIDIYREVGTIFLDEPLQLPLGFTYPVLENNYTMLLTDIEFTPERSNVNMVMIVQTQNPTVEDDFFLSFGASNLCLNPEGFAIRSLGKLSLFRDVEMPIGDSITLVLKGQIKKNLAPNETFTQVNFDCDGFRDFTVSAELILPHSWMRKEVESGVMSNERVVSKINTTIASFDQWTAALSFDSPFQLTSMPGWTYTVQEATFDFSDLANPNGLSFPSEYNTALQNNMWRGLHISRVKVELPKEFMNRDSANRLAFTANNILIDPTGISLNISIDRLLQEEKGAIAGWKFGIDLLELNIVSNTFTNGSMNGKMGIPLLDGLVGYNLLISKPANQLEIDYQFSISPENEMRIPLWLANVDLNSSTRVSLNKRGVGLDNAIIVADLSGNISLGGDLVAGIKDVRFGTLPFEHLVIASTIGNLDSFSITLETLGGVNMNRAISSSSTSSVNTAQVSANPTFGGFPIGIKDFSFDRFRGRKCMFELGEFPLSQERIGIKFQVFFNIADSPDDNGTSENGIGGNTTLGIYGTINPEDLANLNILNFELCGINIDTIRINCQVSGAVSLEGAIAFMAQDPIYGNGIAGFVKAQVPPEFGLTASVLFGEVNNMRYWMVDIQAEFPAIPIDFSVNVLHANSFGGGAWYKMRREQGESMSSAGLGTSASGGIFLPDNSTFFGFEARLGLCGPAGQGIFGEVMFRMEFGNTGAINMAALRGDLWFLDRDKTKSPILFVGEVTLNLREQTLNASLKSFMDVMPDPVPTVLKGTRSGGGRNEMGEIALNFDFGKGKWSLLAGTPTNPNSLGFFAGNQEVFSASSYLMMGNDIPPPADLPKEISDAFREANQPLPSRSRTVSTGSSPADREEQMKFIFGFNAKIPNKDFDLGVFYASVGGMIGMDAQFAPFDAVCASNRDGISGWYASGTAYMKINFAMGIRVVSPFYTGNLIVAEGVAAGVMNAGVANPYYFDGSFFASYQALGGFVEGVKRFEFTYAEDENCIPSSRRSKGFGQLVADVSPVMNETDILLGIEPNILLNFKLNTPTEYFIPNPNYALQAASNPTTAKPTIRKVFRLRYETVSLRRGSVNHPFSIKIADDNMGLTIVPNSFLLPNTLYRFTVKIFAEEPDSKGVYKRMVRNGKNVDTTIDVTFRTEIEPKLFRDEDLIYTTPFKGQNYFMKSDQTQGLILFKTTGANTSYFPKVSLENPKYDNRYYIEIIPVFDPTNIIRVTPTFLTDRVTFNMPTLSNSSRYIIRLVKERVEMTTLMGQRVQKIYSGTELVDSGDGIKVLKKSTRKTGDDRFIMYSFVFSTSKYNKFENKMKNAILLNSNVLFSKSSIPLSIKTDEPFEEFEIFGFKRFNDGKKTIPILNTYIYRADLNNWFTSQHTNQIISNYNKLADATGQSRKITNYLSNRGMSYINNENIKAPLQQLQSTFDLRMASTYLSSYINTSGMTSSFHQIQNQTATSYYLNLSYLDMQKAQEDLEELKSLALWIYQNNKAWNSLSANNQSLVNQILSPSFTFNLPAATDNFHLILNNSKQSKFTTSITTLNKNYNMLQFNPWVNITKTSTTSTTSTSTTSTSTTSTSTTSTSTTSNTKTLTTKTTTTTRSKF